jgi:hypothetical protein
MADGYQNIIKIPTYFGDGPENPLPKHKRSLVSVYTSEHHTGEYFWRISRYLSYSRNPSIL